MAGQVPVDDKAVAADADLGSVHDIAPDLAFLRLSIVNVAFVGRAQASDRNWVLIDAGVFGSTSSIRSAAKDRFGTGARPAAIVMTHGHFDHVGALEELSREWDVPVYAHALERPYLDGTRSYPPADPSVGGGLIALLSPLFPRSPVNVGERLRDLPADGSIPFMPGWRWIHTPGHTPGHVSFWREADRTIIAGDAFITTAQESAYAVLTQKPEIHGPPAYFTSDWHAAAESVRRLAALDPALAVTGHGPPLHGDELRAGLQTLAAEFEQRAVPKGRA